MWNLLAEGTRAYQLDESLALVEGDHLTVLGGCSPEVGVLLTDGSAPTGSIDTF